MTTRNVFGPVPSRRLGRSLGVDLIPPKTCTFNCVYCQVGNTTRKTTRRREYYPTADILQQIEHALSAAKKVDYITFSGSGEPTLAKNIGDVIAGIKRMTSVPVAALTNGSLLYRKDMRRELAAADLVVPSLDAATSKVFRRINQPAEGLEYRRILDGLARFCGEFQGKVWLEVMLVKGINDSAGEIAALKKAITAIRPHRIQINTVVRPPRDASARPVSLKVLKRAEKAFSEVAPTEVIAAPPKAVRGKSRTISNIRRLLVELLRRRPCTTADIAVGLGIDEKVAFLEAHSLVSRGEARIKRAGGKSYYYAGDD